jgi:hypothetical protein
MKLLPMFKNTIFNTASKQNMVARRARRRVCGAIG